MRCKKKVRDNPKKGPGDEPLSKCQSAWRSMITSPTLDLADIKFSKTQIIKMTQSVGFLFFLLKVGLPLLKNVIIPLFSQCITVTMSVIVKKVFKALGIKEIR